MCSDSMSLSSKQSVTYTSGPNSLPHVQLSLAYPYRDRLRRN